MLSTCTVNHLVCRGVWNTNFLFWFYLLYQITLFTKTNIPTLLQIIVFKNKHDPNLHNTFEYNHISYKQILWRYQACVSLENFNMVFKYKNLTQNKIINHLCVDAQYQNPPFLFLIHPLYTKPLFNSKTYKPTLSPLFRSFQTHPFKNVGCTLW